MTQNEQTAVEKEEIFDAVLTETADAGKSEKKAEGEKSNSGMILLAACVFAGFILAALCSFVLNVADVYLGDVRFTLSGVEALHGITPADDSASVITVCLMICVVCAVTGAAIALLSIISLLGGKKMNVALNLFNAVISLLGMIGGCMVLSNADYKWGGAGSLGTVEAVVFALLFVLSLALMFISTGKKIQLSLFGKKLFAGISAVVVVALIIGISVPVAVISSSPTNTTNVGSISLGDDYYSIIEQLGEPFDENSSEHSDVLVWYTKDIMKEKYDLDSEYESKKFTLDELNADMEALLASENVDEARKTALEKQIEEAQGEFDEIDGRRTARIEEIENYGSDAVTVIMMNEGRAEFIFVDADWKASKVEEGEEAPVKKTSSVTIINIYGLDSASGSCILTYKVDYEDGSMCIARTEASYERGGTSYKCVFTDIFGVERQGSKLAVAA